MDAYQYFFDAKGKEVGSVAAGTMEWDAREGHRHWHFTDFAQYNLLDGRQEAGRAQRQGGVLPGQHGRGRLHDRRTRSGARRTPTCPARAAQNTAVAVREVLDIGNGDTYSQDRPGQSFEVTDLPNGTYYIEVKANPANKLGRAEHEEQLGAAQDRPGRHARPRAP